MLAQKTHKKKNDAGWVGPIKLNKLNHSTTNMKCMIYGVIE